MPPEEIKTDVETAQVQAEHFTTPSGAIVDAAGTLQTEPQPLFEVDVPETTPASVLRGAIETPTTDAELRGRITRAEEEQRATQQAVIEATRQSEAERVASERLTTLTQQARESEEIALKRGETLGFARGEAGEVNRANAIQLLAASENLQALTGQRVGKLEALKIRAGFEDTRLERLLGVEEDFKTLKKEEKAEMRNNLMTVLEFSEGKAFEQLDSDSQSQIMQASTRLGLPLSSIQNALTNNAIAKREEVANEKINTLIKQEQLKKLRIDNNIEAISSGSLVRINEEGASIQATTPPKAPTQGQRDDFVFFQRMDSAVEILNGFEDDIADLGIIGQTMLKADSPLLQTKEVEQYRTGMRLFTEARLRKDSGAAIPPEEFRNDALTYFPQPGNTKETLELKKEQRSVALRAIRTASANAYWEFYGENPVDVGQRKLFEQIEAGETGQISDTQEFQQLEAEFPNLSREDIISLIQEQQ